MGLIFDRILGNILKKLIKNKAVIMDCDSGCRGFESRQPPHFYLGRLHRLRFRFLSVAGVADRVAIPYLFRLPVCHAVFCLSRARFQVLSCP